MKPNSIDGDKSALENAVSHLEQAHVPILIANAKKWLSDHPGEQMIRSSRGAREETLHLHLVTNADLVLFQPPGRFSELEERSMGTKEYYRSQQHAVFHRDLSLEIKAHNGYLLEKESDLVSQTPLEKQMQRSPHIHVITFNYLPTFLNLVHTLPRVGTLSLKTRFSP